MTIPCPTYPLYSDSYDSFIVKGFVAVNAAEKSEREEKAKAFRLEKEYAAREEAKLNEKSKPAEVWEYAIVVENAGQNLSAETGGENVEIGRPWNNDLAREVGAGEEQIQKMTVVEVDWNTAEDGAAFSESLTAKRKYEERYIYGRSGKLQNNGNDAGELHE